MSRTRPANGRAHVRPRFRRAGLALTALAASAAALVPAAAHAADPPVTLQSVFVSPISASEPKCKPTPAFTPGILANVAADPTVTQAGASNDVCFGLTLPAGVPATGDDMKRVAVTMPVGLAGEVDSIPKCSDADFDAASYTVSSCPDASMVGTSFVSLTPRVPFPADGDATNTDPSNLWNFTAGVNNIGGSAQPKWTTSFTPAQWSGIDDGGYLYNLEHGPNELAKLGAMIAPSANIAPAKFTISMRLAADGSGRIETVVDNAPKTVYWNGNGPGEDDSYISADGTLSPNAQAGDMYVQAFGIRVWGSPSGRQLDRQDGNPQPLMGGHDFIQWGTNCADSGKAHVDLTTYAGEHSAMDSNAVTMTGCDSLPFLPDVSFTTTSKAPATTTGLDVKVSLGQSTSGPRSALLRTASVTMPEGLEIGAQVASGESGLPLCSAAAFAKDSLTANTCPAGSKAGDVTIVTPLLNRNFVGAVYLGEQPAVGELPPLYLEASPEGATAADAPRIKLVGSVKVDENGRLTTTFADAPELRFSELRLSFPGGDHALFVTPRTCDPATGKSTFTSWAGQTVTLDSSIQMTEDCALPAFSPSLAMVPSSNVVAAKAPVAVGISRADRSPWLKDVKVDLPAGFLSDLTVVTECSVGDAAAGACPESSRIATVTTQAGVGGAPLSLSGKMYLVSPSNGSVADAVIVVHALIGDLDLGNVVVPSRIDLRPTDAGLTLTTSAPLRFKGLALNLRSINVNLDRDNFPLNPTGCGPLTAVASITGDNGAVATPSSTVSYVGCGALPFEPSFEAKLSGETGPKGHPQVDVTMTPRAGDSNLKGARVVLPAGVSTDPKNLQKFCPQADFYAGTCSDATRVGNVSASVSITNDVISGGVYLVKVDGFVLPGLGMSFTGRYPQRVLSTVKVDKSLRVVTEFPAIPDLPLRRLQMTIGGGATGPIQISPDACTADTAWEATFTGQGGQTKQVNVPVPCDTPVAPKTSTKWSRKSGLKLTLTAPTGHTFKSTKITLPSGFKLVSGKARTKYAKIKLSGGKGKIKRSSRSLSSTAKGAGPTKVTYTIKAKGYKLPKSYKNKLKKGKKLKLKYRTVTNDGKVVSKTLTIKVK